MERASCTAELRAEDFDFESKKEIGDGRFARVYAVPFKGEKVAMKVPHRRKAQAEMTVILNRIRHKNIVRFLGTVGFDCRTCCVFELAQYDNLSSIIARGQIHLCSHAVKLRWTDNIASGLSYLHHEIDPSVCHGDLKASNVLIFDAEDDGTTAKIADFGLAKEMHETASVISPGTLFWAAPELLRREAHSLPADVWAFGVTLMELFTWRSPYDHLLQQRKENDIIRAVQDGHVDPLTDLPREQFNNLPERILRVLRGCFERNRCQRVSMFRILQLLSDDPSVTPQRQQRPVRRFSPSKFTERPLKLPPEEFPTKFPTASSEIFLTFSPEMPSYAETVSVADTKVVSLCMVTLGPEGQLEEATVTLPADSNRRVLLSVAAQQLSSLHLSQELVLFSVESTYQCSRRRAVFCFDEKKGDRHFVDLHDGALVERSLCVTSVYRFLLPTSLLPSSPRLSPIIFILCNPELLTIQSSRQFKIAPETALTDPKFVAVIEGVRSGRQFFWNVWGISFLVNAETGEVVQRTKIPGDAKRTVLLFLRCQKCVLRSAVPKGEYLCLLKREGLGLKVRGGKMRYSKVSKTPVDLEAWDFPVMISDLLKDFSAAAQK